MGHGHFLQADGQLSANGLLKGLSRAGQFVTPELEGCQYRLLCMAAAGPDLQAAQFVSARTMG
jgi:hypothetical protein